MESFSVPSKVAAVIHGPGGVGKSTTLRRLAIDLIKFSFTILWVDNPYVFCDSDLDLLGYVKEYLIIIEDWTKLSSNSNLNSKLFSKLENSNNIRILIGDRYIAGKEYRKYVYNNNYFELSFKENENILSWILTFDLPWKENALAILSASEIHKSPLFVILFVFARSADFIINKTKSLVSQFTNIIEDDVKNLYGSYPGLAKSLYYLAIIQHEYKVNITWWAFLNIADHYNGDSSVTAKFKRINTNSEVYITLFRYIFLCEFLNPDLKGVNTFDFHHEVLIESGFSKISIGNLKYDDYTKFEILKILLGKQMFNSAKYLFERIEYKLYLEGFTIDNFVADQDPHKIKLSFDQYVSLAILMNYEYIIEDIYKNALNSNFEFFFALRLWDLIYFGGFSAHAINLILEKTLSYGCQSPTVLSIYDCFKRGELNDVPKIIKNSLNGKIYGLHIIKFLIKEKTHFVFCEFDDKSPLCYSPANCLNGIIEVI